MPSLHDRFSKMKPTEIRAERNLKRQSEQYVREEERRRNDMTDEEFEKRFEPYFGKDWRKKQKQRKIQEAQEKEYDAKFEKQRELTERRATLEQKKEERELKKQEREFKYPSQTYAKKRATAFAGHFFSRAQDVPEKAKGEISSRIQKMKGQAKAPRVSRVSYKHEPGQSTRLPVFAPSTGMGAGVAEETSRQPQQILQPQQQPEFFSQKTAMDFFGSKPQQDILGTSNKYDLGLGSSNGNKKKKEVRYY